MFKWTSMIRLSSALVKPKDSMDQYFNCFADDLFVQAPSDEGFSSSFLVDIYEDDLHYYLKAELPGYDQQTIKISYMDRYLTITGDRDLSQMDPRFRVIRKERSDGRLSRSFLIDQIMEERIKAKMEDGILTLEIPKRPL